MDMSKNDHWLNNSVVSRQVRGLEFESRLGHDFFLPCDIWWLSVGMRLGQQASKSACFVVPPLFRTDSGTNRIKQGENVKGRPSGLVAQLAECLHSKREALGSSPSRATIFSSPVTDTLCLKFNAFLTNVAVLF